VTARDDYPALASWSGQPYGAAVMQARSALDEIDSLRSRVVDAEEETEAVRGQLAAVNRWHTELAGLDIVPDPGPEEVGL
jgi:hypothetical protein